MPRGGFGGGGWYGGRRGGYPLIIRGGGGMGMGGMGTGSPLLTDLLSGGLGYMLGRNQGSGQPTAQVPIAPPPQYYPPQYYPQAAPVQAAPAAGGDSERLAQLKLLDQLHASGTLTDAEFADEKQRILGGA
jgi:hypothetical protein